MRNIRCFERRHIHIVGEREQRSCDRKWEKNVPYIEEKWKSRRKVFLSDQMGQVGSIRLQGNINVDEFCEGA